MQICFSKKVVREALKELRKYEILNYEELADFFESHFPFKANKQCVGKFAKKAGYKRVSQMVNRTVYVYYVREDRDEQ